jgi:RNA recognition motif-containing protein
MNNRLYVGNLAFQTTEDTLQAVFAECGEVTDVKLMLDRETGRSRGFAFVTLATSEAAQNALSRLHGSELDGRALRVDIAQERGSGGSFGRDRR